MTRRQTVDFLLLVALKDELDAALRHFGPVTSGDDAHIATVVRSDGRTIRVAIVNIGMGPENAQRETSSALRRYRSRRALLIGIAAGFPDAKTPVELGDLMVPRRIVNYEGAKVTEKKKGFWPIARVESVVEHREFPESLSLSMWKTAETIAQDVSERWKNRIALDRPSQSATGPTVHCSPRSVLGCGSKIVASEMYEARAWLLREYSEMLGLEMESIGAYHACASEGVELLVVKASQDPATALKDHPADKDAWRPYACDVAAAFAREIVEAYRPSSDELVLSHTAKLEAAVRGYLDKEHPFFNYSVSHAASAPDLKSGIYQARGKAIASLVPDDQSTMIAVIGGGGAGKSHLVRRLLRDMLDADQCPVLLDLGNVSVARNTTRDDVGGDGASIPAAEAEAVSRIIGVASVPQREVSELGTLASESDLVIVIDGLNEIPPTEQAMLLDHVRRLGANGRQKIVITSRIAGTPVLDGFAYASVDALDEAQVRDLYNRSHSSKGEDAFAQLDEKVQGILRRPFFLSLALRGESLNGLRSSSGVFHRFFSERLRMGPDLLAKLAADTFHSRDQLGTLDVAGLRERLGQAEYQRLVEAEVLSRFETGFDHELWRDYLASVFLSDSDGEWTHGSFDKVTVKAQALESLLMTLEQVDDRDRRDAFLRSVYDWNLPAAVACLEFIGERVELEVSAGLRVAVIASICERALDRIAHSREQARAQLREQSSEFAKKCAGLKSRTALVNLVDEHFIDDEWYLRWRQVFSRPDAMPVDEELLTMLAGSDSILGWAASNAIRRSDVSRAHVERLSQLYAVSLSHVVRWRVVHALGAHPEVASVECLSVAFAQDSDLWVRYGAARSLMEVAALAEGPVRSRALSALVEGLATVRKMQRIDRHRILRQVVGSAQVHGAVGAWRAEVMPVLERVLNYADESLKDDLHVRIESWRNSNG